jgi:inner membrane transporter RhtA
MNVDRIQRDPSPRSSLTTLAGRTFGAIPPPALVLLGIVSVQVGSALGDLFRAGRVACRFAGMLS